MVRSAAERLSEVHRRQMLAGGDVVAFRAAHLLEVAQGLSIALRLPEGELAKSRLASLKQQVTPSQEAVVLARALAESGEKGGPTEASAAHLMSETLDLLQATERSGERRKTGSYFTPGPVARALIERSLEQTTLREKLADPSSTVCDPACGGGAFLIEAARQMEPLVGSMGAAVRRLYGTDLSEIALGTTEIALWFLARGDVPVRDDARFVRGDALLGRGFHAQAPKLEELRRVERDVEPLDFLNAFSQLAEHGFDWVVGNPPWVAFQGRATQKISKERRAFYRAHYLAFSGYPTLHGLFVERAAALARSGHVTLLLPSSVSDLDGYRSARACLTRTHQPAEPLPEYGQDAFEGVVQPCFGLIARPRPQTEGDSRPWSLEEKTHAEGQARAIAPPECLKRIDEMQPFDEATFREMGFQSNREVASQLLHRGTEPPPEFTVPLLEGRTVAEFVQRPPQVALRPDQEVLKRTKCKLKPAAQYEKVEVVVRQTASYTIAARHNGLAFRNSLIAAFSTQDVSADLLVGLLNSALYRALHVMRQRDARQAAFPQVKLSHLRRLPRPPMNQAFREQIARLSAEATRQGRLTSGMREQLDELVFDLFQLKKEDRASIREFLRERAPKALSFSE